MWHIVIGHFSCIRTRAIVSALPFLCTNKVCSVDLHSIPDLLITRYMNINAGMKRDECQWDGYPYLHPCVNDNREEADREYVEELEKLKQPHDEGGKGSVHFRPSCPGDCLWEIKPLVFKPLISKGRVETDPTLVFGCFDLDRSTGNVCLWFISCFGNQLVLHVTAFQRKSGLNWDFNQFLK